MNVINKRTAAILGIMDAFLQLWWLVWHHATFRFLERKRPVKKLLINAAGYLGDTVISLAAVDSLIAHYEDAQVTIVAHPRFADLFRGRKARLFAYAPPWLNREKLQWKDVKQYWKFIRRVRSEKFDMAIDLRGDIRNNLFMLYFSKAPARVGYDMTGGSYLLTDAVPYSPMHEIDRQAKLVEHLGGKSSTECRIHFTESELKWARSFVQKHKLHRPLVGVIPAASYATKRWPMERWKETIECIAANTLVIAGPEDDVKTLAKTTVIAQGQDIMKSLALVNQCDVVVGIDSGLMHGAAALHVATVSVFGPTSIERWRPYGEPAKHVVVSTRENCSPCGLLENCPYSIRCMDNITVQAVLAAVGGVL